MEDVRLLLRVCVMLLPLPIFWALYDQQVYMLSAEKLHTGTHTHTHTHIHTRGGLKVDTSSRSDEWKTRKLYSSTRPDASHQCSSHFTVHSAL